MLEIGEIVQKTKQRPTARAAADSVVSLDVSAKNQQLTIGLFELETEQI